MMCRRMGFEETPNYDQIRGMFKNVMQRMNIANDNMFDWCKKKQVEAPKEVPLPVKTATGGRMVWSKVQANLHETRPTVEE